LELVQVPRDDQFLNGEILCSLLEARVVKAPEAKEVNLMLVEIDFGEVVGETINPFEEGKDARGLRKPRPTP